MDAASRAFGALMADVAADSTSQNGMMLGYLGYLGDWPVFLDEEARKSGWTPRPSIECGVTPLQVVDPPRSPIDKGLGAAEQT